MDLVNWVGVLQILILLVAVQIRYQKKLHNLEGRFGLLSINTRGTPEPVKEVV